MEDLVTSGEAPRGAPASRAGVVEADLERTAARLEEEFDAMAGDRVLLTGGAGFLGYYLVQSILHRNAAAEADRRVRLTVADNFSRGLPGWLEERRGTAELTVLEHDVTRPLPEEAGAFDWVLHAASIASPTVYRRRPIDTMDANVGGLRRLLDRCRAQQEGGDPVKGFLFFSSSEVYGDPDPEHIPTPESYWGRVSFTGPRACYDESKRFGETLCVNFARVHDLPVRAVRPFNNYGPGLGLDDRRVIPDFARDVLAGRDVVLLSDGSPTRTFCYVSDAVVGYYRALVRGADGEAYNVGTDGPEVSMAELAEDVARIGGELFGYEGRVVREESGDPEYLTDNPDRRCPDIAKARRELGYEPEVGLEEGLRRSLLWYAGGDGEPARAEERR